MADELDLSLLAAFLEELDLKPLPPDWEGALRRLYTALLAANEQVNLTRLTSPQDFMIKHVADSLLLLAAWPQLRTAALRVADIGCGAGFPGLPLALFCPRWQVTEVDSVGKKIVCVERFIAEMGLTNCRAVHAHTSELWRQEEHRGAYDLVLARAVGPMAKLVPDVPGLLDNGAGRLIVYKTPQGIEEEQSQARRAVGATHGKGELSQVFTLPLDQGDRQLVCVRWIADPRKRPGSSGRG